MRTRTRYKPNRKRCRAESATPQRPWPGASRRPHLTTLDQQRVGHFIVAFMRGSRPRSDTTRWLNQLLGRDANGVDDVGGWMGVGVRGPGVAGVAGVQVRGIRSGDSRGQGIRSGGCDWLAGARRSAPPAIKIRGFAATPSVGIFQVPASISNPDRPIYDQRFPISHLQFVILY